MTTCPKCNGDMLEGYVVNYTTQGAMVARWVQGPPQPGIFWEVDPTVAAEFNILTYCCRHCGFLESYRGSRVE